MEKSPPLHDAEQSPADRRKRRRPLIVPLPLSSEPGKPKEVMIPLRETAPAKPSAERPVRTERPPKPAVKTEEAAGASVDLPAGHRLERSVWHAIEVDKTGKAVENPAVEYGDEYYHERRHEATPIDENVSAAAGEVALVAAAINDKPKAADHDTADIPSANTRQKLGPTAAAQKTVQAVRQTAGSPLWPYVVVLLAIIITIIIIALG